MSKLPVKSVDTFRTASYKVGIFIFSAGAVTLFGYACRGKYVDGGAFVMAIALLVFDAVVIYYYRQLKRIRVYERELELHYVAGNRVRVYQLSDFSSWSENHQKSKGEEWDVLRLYGQEGAVVISSRYCANYGTIKARLTAQLPRNLRRERQFDNRETCLVGSLFLLFAVGLVSVFYHTSRQSCTSGRYVAVTGTVAGPVAVKRYKSSRSINLDLQEYPDPGFVLKDRPTRIAEERSITGLSAGDTVTILIGDADYQATIIHTIPWSGWSRIFGYGRVEVLGVRTAAQVFCTPEETVADDAKGSATEVLVFAGIMFLAGALILSAAIRKIRSGNREDALSRPV